MKEILEYVKKTSSELAKQILLLWVVFNDETVPLWVKALIVAAMTYFLNPIDAIPDVVPFVGWTDDAGVVAGALAQVGWVITENHRLEAEKLFKQIFG